MPPDVHPGKLYKPPQTDKNSKPVLMYPENKLLGTEATLASQPGVYHAGAKFHISLDNGRKFRVRAIKAMLVNPEIEQFTFEYLDLEDSDT